jgi:hypothetical protein
MPIARGEGIDQRMLVHLQRRLGAGGWAHVFPEGRCYQTGNTISIITLICDSEATGIISGDVELELRVLVQLLSVLLLALALVLARKFSSICGLPLGSRLRPERRKPSHSAMHTQQMQHTCLHSFRSD